MSPIKTRFINFLSNLIMSNVVTNCTEEVYSKLLPEVKNEICKLSGNYGGTIEIKIGDRVTKLKSKAIHEKFDTVLKLVNMDIPVYLGGEAGTGKNVICKQVAEALGLDFYFTNAVTQEYKLTGFIDANGTYHETQFYKAFKNGGLFFLDELDASIPEVLVILNAAIANRYFDFPTGKIEANKNFRLIAAGNTLGTGADNVYSGRYCLDGASLDRFSIIQIPYSKKIEECITNKDKELIEFCHMYREAVAECNINSIFSYRGLTAISRLKGSLPTKDILNICLIKGMNTDDLRSIQNSLRNRSVVNSYLSTFLSIK